MGNLSKIILFDIHTYIFVFSYELYSSNINIVIITFKQIFIQKQ